MPPLAVSESIVVKPARFDHAVHDAREKFSGLLVAEHGPDSNSRHGVPQSQMPNGYSHATQFELFDVAPHAKPLLFVTEAAQALDCSPDQVLALVDCGALHAVAISDAPLANRLHVRLTRLSVQRRRQGQAAPALPDYGITALRPSSSVCRHVSPDHWCLATRKEVLRVDELATLWRICANQVRALLPQINCYSISDQAGPRQHWRVPTVNAQAFIDRRLVERNFTDL